MPYWRRSFTPRSGRSAACRNTCSAAERNPDVTRRLNSGAQQRRQKTLEALTTQLEALSRSNPVLMSFEDVHWIDPTSLEVLGRLVDRLRMLRVLLIVTHRPELLSIAPVDWSALCHRSHP